MLLIILACLTMASAVAQTYTVNVGQTSELSAVQIPGDTYKWELYNEVSGLNFVTAPGNCPTRDAIFINGISNGPSVKVTWLSPGTYFYKVTALRAGCTMNLKVGKIIVVALLRITSIIQSAPICQGQTANIRISLQGTPPWNIEVNDGTNTIHYDNITTTPYIIPVTPGITTSYTVIRVTDATEKDLPPSNTMTVVVNPLPNVKLTAQNTLCSEQPVLLDPGAFASYLWQDMSTDPTLIADHPGLYSVVVTDLNGCPSSDSLLLSPCEMLVWMPNAFSPNSDGINDVFLAKYNPSVNITFQMLIFNKWGEQLFSTTDINKGWDGTFRGVACPMDLYTWTIIFSAPVNFSTTQKSPQQGNVMLLK